MGVMPPAVREKMMDYGDDWPLADRLECCKREIARLQRVLREQRAFTLKLAERLANASDRLSTVAEKKERRSK